jgi:hypothetical protein
MGCSMSLRRRTVRSWPALRAGIITTDDPGKNSGQVSRLLERLRTHGLIKKVRNSYRYYLTKLGQRVLLIALKLRRFYLIPELARGACA